MERGFVWMPSSRTSGADLLFLDTSVLVRLYYLDPDDPFSWVVALVQRPEASLAASHLAYVETLAAFHALRRGRAISPRRQSLLSAAFKEAWPSFLRVPLSPPVVQLASFLAEAYPLRGRDALQLASFLWLRQKKGTGQFFTLDRRLYQVAKGLVPMVPVPPFAEEV
ncbi:MAG: type II toxin-antitoxin system VapC family toxin [Thermus sp.]|nr:type II toxin-antitoxin system VapC family toxin [Thermus sp.]